MAKAGYRLRPHVVGDAAIDEALTAFEYADKTAPLNGRRWMMDHAFLLLPDHYPRVSKLGLILNSQYMHNAQLGPLILRAWGPGLANKSEAYKDWVAHGLMIAGGSDGPISYHAAPIYEIYGEVTRQTLWGGSLGPDQGITREQAIRTVTINGAYTTFEENVKGSIEAGKYADFVVLSGDILTGPAERIKDLNVRATVLAGKTSVRRSGQGGRPMNAHQRHYCAGAPIAASAGAEVYRLARFQSPFPQHVEHQRPRAFGRPADVYLALLQIPCQRSPVRGDDQGAQARRQARGLHRAARREAARPRAGPALLLMQNPRQCEGAQRQAADYQAPQC